MVVVLLVVVIEFKVIMVIKGTMAIRLAHACACPLVDRNMVCSTMARLQMSGRLWVNDPDCMILREKASGGLQSSLHWVKSVDLGFLEIMGSRPVWQGLDICC